MASLTDHALRARPEHLTSTYKDFTPSDIAWIVSRFRVEGEVEVSPFDGRGNINIHTYQIWIDGREFLLQKVNSEVFTVPERVMASMQAVIESQNAALSEGYPAPRWQPIELIPTAKGERFLDLTDRHGRNVWRLMVRIPDCVCYKSLVEAESRAEQLRLAREMGRGLAIYGDLTASVDSTQLKGSLPGYRDTALYYQQFHSVVAGTVALDEVPFELSDDMELRGATDALFFLNHRPEELERRLTDPLVADAVALLKAEEGRSYDLWRARDTGSIRQTLIHGDTKIENFLFCPSTQEAIALVDLDTIMPFTWLADWGDMVRSLVNIAGETERDLDRVQVDQEVYAAVTEGFRSAAKGITAEEIALMPRAVEIITLELGLRFLTDYLRGDNYFQLGPTDPPDLNRTRGLVQLTLYRRLREMALATSSAVHMI